MKKSFKILIFLMAFAFMGVMNVRAECSSKGNNMCNSNGVSCSGLDQAACESASVTGVSCCNWTDDPVDPPEEKDPAVITCHNKAYNGETQTIATCEGGTISNATHKDPGSYKVECDGDADHENAADKTCSINKLSPFSGATTTTINLEVGQSKTFSFKKQSLCDESKYSVSATGPITVTGSSVKGNGTGSGTITMSYTESTYCKAGSDSISVRVTSPSSQPAVKPTISGTGATVSEPKTVDISPKATVNGADVSSSGTFTCSGTSNYLTVDSANCKVTVNSLPVNNVSVPITIVFKSKDTSKYENSSGSVNINLTGSGNSAPVKSVDPTHALVAVTPADGTVSNNFVAKDKDGNPTQVKWTVSGEGVTYTCNDNTTTCTVQFQNMGTNCSPKTREVTVTATGKDDSTASKTITVYSYRNWAEYSKTGTVPNGANNPTGMKYSTGCEAYDKVDKGGTYTKYYNRCCGGPSSESPACYKTPNGSYVYGKYANKTGYTQVDDSYCEEENPLCYKNTVTGVYDWGKHAQDDVWAYVSDKEDDCKDKPVTEDPACYKKGDEYYWGKYKGVDGYTVTSLTEAQCKKFCYKVKATGAYTWGNHEGDSKYEVVASITDETKCKGVACYKCGDDYKWGNYDNDNTCEVIPGVTTENDCKGTSPHTGLSISNILYAVGAFLVIMGCGIVVYQLTKVKQQLD